ncbi:hypothetical protein [Paracoccus gahaiensis]|uniref:hypothetical protein n=1 Tax=Paracoccus gahaiensis TaxID=1706839 RepID=UPI00145F01D0|nr:hypothetical protein [Paracoccus gahaiensis]
MTLQGVLDPAVEASNHAVGLHAHGRGQAMLDAEIGAEAGEIVVAGGAPAAEAEQKIGE